MEALRKTSRRATKAVTLKRVSVIIEMISNATTRANILRFISENWGLTERQGENLIAKANEVITEEIWEKNKTIIESSAKILEGMLQRCIEEGKYKTALDILKERCDRVSGKPRQSIHLDAPKDLPALPDLSDDELDTISGALYGGGDDSAS